MLLLEILAWVLFAYVVGSLLEYVLHRWPMHSARFARRFPWLEDEHKRHAVLHHAVFYPGKRFRFCPDPAGRFISTDLSPFFNLILLSPLWAPLYFISHLGCAVFVVCAALHGVVWTLIHREMHEPRQRWFARTRLYKFWHDYHETHHKRQTYNFNVVLPGADHVFGTYLPPAYTQVS
jgi:hypothetical protein